MRLGIDAARLSYYLTPALLSRSRATAPRHRRSAAGELLLLPVRYVSPRGSTTSRRSARPRRRSGGALTAPSRRLRDKSVHAPPAGRLSGRRRFPSTASTRPRSLAFARGSTEIPTFNGRVRLRGVTRDRHRRDSAHISCPPATHPGHRRRREVRRWPNIQLAPGRSAGRSVPRRLYFLLAPCALRTSRFRAIRRGAERVFFGG